jgi:hypothetical protein
MFNILDNRLRLIKHLENKFFGGVDVVMTFDFCQGVQMGYLKPHPPPWVTCSVFILEHF